MSIDNSTSHFLKQSIGKEESVYNNQILEEGTMEEDEDDDMDYTFQ